MHESTRKAIVRDIVGGLKHERIAENRQVPLAEVRRIAAQHYREIKATQSAERAAATGRGTTREELRAIGQWLIEQGYDPEVVWANFGS